MNEKGRIKIILAIFAIMLISIVGLLISIDNKNKKQLEKFDNYFESETEKLIYIARDDCYYCQLLETARKEVLKNNKIDYYYVNTNKITNSVLNKMLDKLGISQNEFGTPTLAVVKDKTVVKIQSGIFSDQTDNVKEMAEFINTNKVADLTDFIANYKTSEEGK